MSLVKSTNFFSVSFQTVLVLAAELRASFCLHTVGIQISNTTCYEKKGFGHHGVTYHIFPETALV